MFFRMFALPAGTFPIVPNVDAPDRALTAAFQAAARRRMPGPPTRGWGERTLPLSLGDGPVAARVCLAQRKRGRWRPGLRRRPETQVRGVHIQDDRDRARWQRELAAEHSRELIVRKQQHRGRAQLEVDVRPPGPPRWPAGSPIGCHAEELRLPQGVAPSPPGGVPQAPAALPGHSGQLSGLKDVRLVRPRGGLQQHLRDEGDAARLRGRAPPPPPAARYVSRN